MLYEHGWAAVIKTGFRRPTLVAIGSLKAPVFRKYREGAAL
jgi:hypothetical protein